MRHSDPIVRSYSVTHPPGDVHLPNQTGWDQIIYAASGSFVAKAGREAWTVPPRRALCIGNGTQVRLMTGRPTAVRCLYLRSELSTITTSIRVINLTRLTLELLLQAVDRSPFSRAEVAGSSLLALLVEQLDDHPTVALQLPLPNDSRARELTEVICSEPAVGLADAIRVVGASRRTLERLFVAETTMTLGGWQRRARVLAAIELMADGRTVTFAAAAVGYSTPSAFVAAFRSELGQTPRAFMNDHRTA